MTRFGSRASVGTTGVGRGVGTTLSSGSGVEAVLSLAVGLTLGAAEPLAELSTEPAGLGEQAANTMQTTAAEQSRR